MVTAHPMSNLYRRLGEAGLPRAFVRGTALPSWWDDDIAANPAGYAQGLLLLSRHLGLDATEDNVRAGLTAYIGDLRNQTGGLLIG